MKSAFVIGDKVEVQCFDKYCARSGISVAYYLYTSTEVQAAVRDGMITLRRIVGKNAVQSDPNACEANNMAHATPAPFARRTASSTSSASARIGAVMTAPPLQRQGQAGSDAPRPHPLPRGCKAAAHILRATRVQPDLHNAATWDPLIAPEH